PVLGDAGRAFVGLAADVVAGLARRAQKTGRLVAECFEELGLGQRTGRPQLLFERVDRRDELALAVAGDRELLGHALQERAHLGFGITPALPAEGAIRDLVRSEMRRGADDVLAPVGLIHRDPQYHPSYEREPRVRPAAC